MAFEMFCMCVFAWVRAYVCVYVWFFGFFFGFLYVPWKYGTEWMKNRRISWIFTLLTFLFCFIFHSHHTYSSLIPADYGNETDDDDQNGNDDTNKGDANNSAPNSLQPNIDTHETNEQQNVATIPVDATDENQIHENNEIFAPIDQPEPTIENGIETPTELSSCDVNNGGCEQTCTMVPDEEIGASVVECSCQIGFYLDERGRKCLSKFIICVSFYCLNAFGWASKHKYVVRFRLDWDFRGEIKSNTLRWMTLVLLRFYGHLCF